MISRLSQIAKEDVDARFRNLADSAYTKVKSCLKQESRQQRQDFDKYLDTGSGDQEYSYSPIFLTENKSVEGYSARASDLGVGEGKYPLIFLFGTKAKIKSPALGWIGSNKVILLFNNLQNPFDLNYADTRLNPSIFRHEFIHYLDVCRKKTPGGAPDKGRGFATDNPDFDYGKYFNNSDEMNAYYQETAGVLVNIVNTFVENNYEEGLRHLRSYEDFFNFFQKFFNRDWMEALTPSNRKKVQKRLYDLYTTIKSKQI